MLERLLIVGLGSIGIRHARIARQLIPSLQIVALRHNKGSADTEFHVDHQFDSMNDVMSFGPQAAIVANPASMHVDIAMRLADAGIHLLIEKPISNSPRRVQDLIDLCRDRNVVLMTGYNLRFSRSLRRFRECVHKGLAGNILSVRAEIGQYLPSWRPNVDYRKSVSAREELGGGVLLELSHEIDYLRWIFGEVDWVSATLKRQSSLEIDVEDSAFLTLGFAGGTETAPGVASLNMDFIRHDTVRTCTAIGDKGTLRWNALTGVIDMFARDGAAWNVLSTDPDQRDDTYLAEWRHFLACMENHEMPLVSGEDGLAVMRVVQAARESSVYRKVVQIAPATYVGECTKVGVT
mgnify:CR=1 FL=1